MLQHAEHAGQLGVNVLDVKACAEVQIRDKVAVIGNEGLAVAYTQNRIPAVSCHALHRLLGAVLCDLNRQMESADLVYQLGLVHDPDNFLRHGCNDLLAVQRTAAALDGVELRVDLIYAVDCQINVIQLVDDLYLTFARIGVCTFGGGYAMLPILQREVVENRHWATEDELMDYYAIGQCTPGVIAVNTSTFIGCKTHGILGGIAATAGMITPSLIIITIIAAFIQQFAHLAVVQHAFAGIRIAVCALVLQSVWKMAKKGVVDVPTSVILLVTFAAVAFFGVSPVVMVIVAAIAGIAIGMIRRKRA